MAVFYSFQRDCRDWRNRGGYCRFVDFYLFGKIRSGKFYFGKRENISRYNLTLICLGVVATLVYSEVLIIKKYIKSAKEFVEEKKSILQDKEKIN